MLTDRPGGPKMAASQAKGASAKGFLGSQKGPSFQEKWAQKFQTGAVGIFNKTVRPAGALWWCGPLLPLLVWVVIPILRAKVLRMEVYESPAKIKRLYARGWAVLGWVGIAWTVLCGSLLFEPFAHQWAPSAWFGLRADLAFRDLVWAAWSGALLLAFSLIFFLFRLSRSALHDGEHGAAAWAQWSDVICSPTRRWSLPMRAHYRGVRRRWNLDDSGTGVAVLGPPEESVCSHVLLQGGTGSGKGSSIFGHIIASSTVPIIYQDVKGEVPFGDSPQMKDGIRWGCAAEGGWPSLRWNPLEEARNEKGLADQDSAFETLASMLLPTPQGREDSWVQEVGRPILAEGLKTGQFETLGDFADTVRDIPLIQILAQLNVPKGLQNLLKGTNVPEYIGSAFYSNLSCYRSGWGRVMTSAHDFTLNDIIRKGGYILSAESEATRMLPLQLFWRMLLRKLMRSTGKVPLTLLLDEGLSAGKVPNLRQALETLRNRGVSLWMGIQSESGLLDVYTPTTGKAIVDTFGNRVTLLHGLDSQDAENLQKRLGTWTMRRRQPGGVQPGVQAQVSPIPLLPTSEMNVRGKRLRDRWAVFEMRESSLSGLPIIARTLEAPFPTRRPSADELAAFYVQYPDLRPEIVAKLGRMESAFQVQQIQEAVAASTRSSGIVAKLFSESEVSPPPPVKKVSKRPVKQGGRPASNDGDAVEGVVARVASQEALGGWQPKLAVPSEAQKGEATKVVEMEPLSRPVLVALGLEDRKPQSHTLHH